MMYKGTMIRLTDLAEAIEARKLWTDIKQNRERKT